MSNWKSRSYWLGWGILILASALVWGGKVSGEGWVTTSLAVYATWQGRRAFENNLTAKKMVE